MQTLLEILLRLLDLFCWLCSKREKLEQRLSVERNMFDTRRNRKAGR
jgi:hypothetical protein